MEDAVLMGLLSVTAQPQPRFNRENNCSADGGDGEALALVNEAAGTFGQSQDVIRLTENRSSKIANIQMLHSSCIIHWVPSFSALHRQEGKRINCLLLPNRMVLYDH